MKIDETHDLVVEPGPYPPGEGPSDYVECSHRCGSLETVCVSEWPADGWLAVDEPDRRGYDSVQPDGVDDCSRCRRPLGYIQVEYDGEYGLRLVEAYVEPWTHPDLPDVYACEDCSMVNWDG